MEPNADGERARVGLCTRCRYAAVQRSARGGRFWRCRRADSDPAYRRYPPLPVQRCPGFEPGDPDDEPKPSEVPAGLRRTAARGYHWLHGRRWR